MTSLRKSLPFSLALASITLASICSADTVVSNFGDTINRNQIRQGFANSFTLGANDAVLNSISLNFRVSSSDTSFLVNICSDNAGSIGSVVCSSTATAPGTEDQLLTFSGFSGNTTLTGSSTYWVTITAVGNTNSSSGWYDANDSSTSGYGWTINNARRYYSLNAWWNPSTGSEQFSIDATVVPEPSTYAALFGLAALGSVAIRRKR